MICQVAACAKIKTKENFKLLAPESVGATYQRRSLTRGSKYSDLTRKLLVYWKIVRRGGVDAYKRWSKPEV